MTNEIQCKHQSSHSFQNVQCDYIYCVVYVLYMNKLLVKIHQRAAKCTPTDQVSILKSLSASKEHRCPYNTQK